MAENTTENKAWEYVTSNGYLAKKLFFEKKIALTNFKASKFNTERTAFVFLFDSKEQCDEIVVKSREEIKEAKAKKAQYKKEHEQPIEDAEPVAE